MSETASTSATSSASSTQSTNQSQSTNESKGAAPAANQNQQTIANNASDGLEEIKIGSVSARVSKEIAQAVKNLERGFQTKAQEAAANKKLATLAKENPKEFYKQTGQDAYEFAETLLAERYAEMQMSPEEKAQKEKLARLDKFEKQESSSKKELISAIQKEFGPLPEGAENATREQLIQYARHQQQVYQRESQTLDSDIGNAFKESGLAPDKHLLAKVAFEMSAALKRGKSLSAADAIARVKAEYFAGAKQTLGNMEMKKFHEVMGDEFLEKFRKYDLERVTSQAASKLGQQTQGHATASSPQPKKVLNEIEWRKAMGIS